MPSPTCNNDEAKHPLKSPRQKTNLPNDLDKSAIILMALIILKVLPDWNVDVVPAKKAKVDFAKTPSLLCFAFLAILL